MNVNPEQPVERQERWQPVEGIATPAGGALLADGHDGLDVTLLFSEIKGGIDSDLHIKFGHVLAYSVYEEFVHPWETLEAEPRLAGRWERYIYPLLEIKDSKWIASLPDLLTIHPNCIHYRLLTLDQIVDVLSCKPPEVSWVSGRPDER